MTTNKLFLITIVHVLKRKINIISFIHSTGRLGNWQCCSVCQLYNSAVFGLPGPDPPIIRCHSDSKIYRCNFLVILLLAKALWKSNLLKKLSKQWPIPGVSNLLAKCAKFPKINFEWAAFDQKVLWHFIWVWTWTWFVSVKV